MTWSWRTQGMDRPSRVTFELLPKAGGTELVFRHAGEAFEPAAEGLEGGWPKMLDRLRARVRKEKRP